MSQYLKYNSKNTGVSAKELKKLEPKLKRAGIRLAQIRETAEQGFMSLPYDTETVKIVEREAKRVRANFKEMIVVAVGGASLGAQTIYTALGAQKGGVKLHFMGMNTDPDSLSRLLDQVDLKCTAINVISKSGSTMETMSNFLLLREALIKKVGKKKHAQHIVAITDLRGGVLQTIAEREGYAMLPHPLNVGGRFSVLSTVGLFPAACAGLSIKRLLKGARSVEDIHQGRGHRSEPARFAALHYLGYTKHRQTIHVCMPYTDALRKFGLWYRQLWAESLGKTSEIGPTPVAALGATDQHSQLQLYLEGPTDKIVTLIKVNRFASNPKVPKDFSDISEIGYFQGKSMTKLLHTELEATRRALVKTQTPVGILEIPKVSEESLGALFMFYELACAYLGELFGINTYNQPGVKLEKDAAKRILSRK